MHNGGIETGSKIFVPLLAGMCAYGRKRQASKQASKEASKQARKKEREEAIKGRMKRETREGRKEGMVDRKEEGMVGGEGRREGWYEVLCSIVKCV